MTPAQLSNPTRGTAHDTVRATGFAAVPGTSVTSGVAVPEGDKRGARNDGAGNLNPSVGAGDPLSAGRAVDRSGGRGPSASPGPRSTPHAGQPDGHEAHGRCEGCDRLVPMETATAIVTAIRDLGISLQVISQATGLSASMLSEICHQRRPRVRCTTVAKLRAADTEMLVAAYPGVRHQRLVAHLEQLREAGISDRAIARRAGLPDISVRRALARLPRDHVYDALMSLQLGDFPEYVHIDATLATRRLVLLTQYMPTKQIAAATGLDDKYLARLRKGHIQHIPLRTHKALFALPVPATPHPSLPTISWEAHRRVRALLAAGWGTRRIATASGLTRDAVRALIASPQTTVATANRAIAASKRLAATPAPQDTPARRAREYAATIAAAPLSAWTAHTITDPDATPLTITDPDATAVDRHQLRPSAPDATETATRQPADTRRGVKQVWVEDLADLATWGAAWPEVEARTGLGRDSIQRILLRHERTDLTERVSANTTGVVA